MISLNNKHKLAFPIEAVTGNFLFTTTQDVWVGYRILHQVFPLNKLDFFKEYIEDSKGLFEHDKYEFHLMNIPKKFNLDDHIEETIEHLVQGEFADLGEIYFQQAGDILKDEVQINQYDTYLFVRITPTIQVANPLEYIELFKDVGTRFIHQLTGQRIPRQTLLSIYRKAEQQLHDDLLNYKMIERLDTKSIGRLFYYFFHRTENNNQLEKELVPESMTEGVITNENGYMTIEQLHATHYVAFLSFVKLPDSMFGSAFIQNLQDSLSFPIETHIKLMFEHELHDRRSVYKMRKRLLEQDKEQGTVDGILDDDETILFGEERLRELNNQLRSKDTRLCRMSMTIVISAESIEDLEERIKDIEFVLDGTKYEVYCPIVDQLTLFDQCLVGSSVKFRSFEHVVTTGYVGDLGLDLEKEVGNRYGLPLGRIITAKKYKSVQQALSMSSKIVWFFPNLTKRAIEGALHTNGNTLITGPPGQGKSVLVKNIFLWLTFLGQKILYVDPKNETEIFFRKAVEAYSDIPEFVELYERINFVSISDDEKYRGMLDPLLFLPREQAIQTARNILNAFGEVNIDRANTSRKKALILEAVESVVNGSGKKHLSNVIELIRKKDEELAKLLSGYTIGLGKVLIGNDNSQPIRFENQINVLGTQGLQIPTQKEIEGNNLNQEQIAGMAIMEVIMRLTYIFSTDKNEDAAIIFDEAKGFEDTAQGRFLIDDSLRKGRANSTDNYIITQAFMDYDKEDKKELLSYKFAFRPNQQAAQEKVLDFFGMEINQANLQLIDGLKAGTCLFQDHKGRNQPIAIDVLFDSWLLATSSTQKQDEVIQKALSMEQN